MSIPAESKTPRTRRAENKEDQLKDILAEFPFAKTMKFHGNKIYDCLTSYCSDNIDRLRALDGIQDVEDTKKKNSATIGKPCKILVRYVLERYLWEIHGLYGNSEDYDEVNIFDWITTKIRTKFPANISELIVFSGKRSYIEKTILESRGLEMEILNRISDSLPFWLAVFVAETATKWVKLMAHFISNDIYYGGGARTASDKHFRTAMANIEILIPSANQVRDISREWEKYLKLANPQEERPLRKPRADDLTTDAGTEPAETKKRPPSRKAHTESTTGTEAEPKKPAENAKTAETKKRPPSRKANTESATGANDDPPSRKARADKSQDKSPSKKMTRQKTSPAREASRSGSESEAPDLQYHSDGDVPYNEDYSD